MRIEHVGLWIKDLEAMKDFYDPEGNQLELTI